MEKITSGDYIQIHVFFSGYAKEAFAPLSLSEWSVR